MMNDVDAAPRRAPLCDAASIRRRPGMYVGATDARGIFHLAETLLDLAVGDGFDGPCRSIQFAVGRDGSFRIEDDGRGVLVERGTEHASLLDLLEGKRRVGAQDTWSFADWIYSGIGWSGDLLAVGNALSEWLEVEVRSAGGAWRQRFAKGFATSSIEYVGPADATGTRITLKPDPEIFEGAELDRDQVATRLLELAYLNPRVRFSLQDERTDFSAVYDQKGGVVDFVRSLNSTHQTLHPPFLLTGRFARGEVAIGLQYRVSEPAQPDPPIRSFVNLYETVDAGVHVRGFKQGVAAAVSAWARRQERIPWSARDLGEGAASHGLTAVVALLLRDPQYMGPRRSWLGGDGVREPVRSITYIQLSQRLEENAEAARQIFGQILAAPRRSRAGRSG